MYKSYFLYILIILFLCECKKSESNSAVVDLWLSSKESIADGGTVDSIYASISINSEVDKRIIFFRTATGLFPNGSDTFAVYANRNDLKKDKWTALALWTSSLRSGPDTIWASTNTNPQEVTTIAFLINPSLADSIKLTSSAFSVPVNYGGEITVTGTLYSKTKSKVSLGTMVKFNDYYLNGDSVHGFFRNVINQSDANSQVSFTYTPGKAIADTSMFIKAIISGGLSTPNPIPDSVEIYISK